mmetsp:Transcript_25426/g.64624  ORF Transcript_25426/g.64624 Transcript_25426/m.64624 type:complete len:242 (-) Transcript_25426:1444-2169(-)
MVRKEQQSLESTKAAEQNAADETLQLLLQLGFTEQQFEAAKAAAHGSTQAAAESLITSLPDTEADDERSRALDAIPTPDPQREVALAASARRERDERIAGRERETMLAVARDVEMQAARTARAATEEAVLKASDPVYARFRVAQERREAGAEGPEGCIHPHTIEESFGHSLTVTQIHCVTCGLRLKVAYSSTWESGDPHDEIYDAPWHERWLLREGQRGGSNDVASHHVIQRHRQHGQLQQ